MLSENVTMIPRYSIARQRIAQFTLEDHNGPVLPLHPYRNVDQTLGCCPLSPLWKMTGRAELRHDWVFHCRYNTPNTPQTLNINPLPSLYPLPSLLIPLSSPFSSLLMWTTFCFSARLLQRKFTTRSWRHFRLFSTCRIHISTHILSDYPQISSRKGQWQWEIQRIQQLLSYERPLED